MSAKPMPHGGIVMISVGMIVKIAPIFFNRYESREYVKSWPRKAVITGVWMDRQPWCDCGYAINVRFPCFKEEAMVWGQPAIQAVLEDGRWQRVRFIQETRTTVRIMGNQVDLPE